KKRQSDPRSPEFRRARARLGAFALNNKRPSLAQEAGRKGGESTSSKFGGGKHAWGLAMALKRWHKTPFDSRRSRARVVRSGGEGNGIPEPDLASAPKKPLRRKRNATVQQQG